MKIAITGGMGFIGLRLAQKLIEQGHHPVLIDSLTPQIHGDLPLLSVPEGALIQRVDVRALAQHHEIIEGCDVIYHLAAETGTAQSMYQIQQYVSVNDLGTAALLEGVARCTSRPKQIVLASSRSVYGEGAYRDPLGTGKLIQPNPRTADALKAARWEHVGPSGQALCAVPTPEHMGLAPGSVYAATKASQELLIASASLALGIRSTVLRFQNVYGEGQSLRNPYTGIISIFFNRARQGKDIPIYEDGLESRDFVHVDDVVAALVRSIETDLPPGAVMNVGSGQPTTVQELVTTLLRVSGLNVPVHITGQFRVGDIRHGFAEISSLKQHLGLEPCVSLADGLARFCAWAKTQPIHVDKLDIATAQLRANGLAP